ncbi:MAG: hypothetical protein IID49_04870 [Proteobacteria bacterium]|nr:hypothetical protein [Pseudomonadota bacterium]
MHTSDTIQDAIDRVRDKLLALFDALAPRLIGKTEAEIEALLMDAVREALEELPTDDGPMAA